MINMSTNMVVYEVYLFCENFKNIKIKMRNHSEKGTQGSLGTRNVLIDVENVK